MRYLLLLLFSSSLLAQPGIKTFPSHSRFPWTLGGGAAPAPPVPMDTSCVGCRPLATFIDTSAFVAYWPLDGNGNDTTANHNDLIIGAGFDITEPHTGAGSVYNGFGVFGGKAGGGDGGTNVAWVESNPSLLLGGGSWSVGIGNRCANGGAQVVLISKVRWSTGVEWEVGRNAAGKYYVMMAAGDSVYTSDVTLTSDSSETPCTNYNQAMDLIVATFDATTDTLGISVNGGPSKKVKTSANVVNTYSPVSLLCRNATGNGYGSRGIDQPFIAKARLTDTQINQLYNQRYGLTWGFKERPMATLDPSHWATKAFAVYDSLGMDSTLIYNPPGQETNWLYSSYDLFGKIFSNSQGLFSIQRRGLYHVDSSGIILQFTQTDSATNTWTHTVFGDSVGIDDRNVGGGRDPAGSACVVFWHTAGTPATEGQTYYRRSADLGATWGPKLTFPSQYRSGTGFVVPFGPLSHIVDTLYQGFYLLNAAYVYRSMDDGVSWQFLSRIDSLTDISETAVLALRGDTMIAVARWENKGFLQYSSIDAGHTWRKDGPIAPVQFGTTGLTGSFASGSQISPWLYRDADTVYFYWALRNAFISAGDRHTLLLGFTSAHVSRVAGCAYNWWHEFGGAGADGPGAWPVNLTYWSKCGGVGGNEGYQSVIRDKWGKLRFSWCQGRGSGGLGTAFDAPNIYITK